MLIFLARTEKTYAEWRLAQQVLRNRQLPRRPVPIPARWYYSGDGDMANGGAFFDIATWEWGYVDAVRVSDLDSACGFVGAVLIEHVTIHCANKAHIRNALASYGGASCCLPSRHQRRRYAPADIKQQLRWMIASALMDYGYCSPDNQWNSHEGEDEIIQTLQDGEMAFDGWRVTYRLEPDEDLRTYLINKHLSY